jgi:toxin ParE1/3/4
MSAPRVLVVLTDEARDDLQSIALYGVLNWGEDEAAKYHARIADVLESLARFPALGRRATDVAGEVRSVAVGNHRIFYRVETDAVLVLRVMHQRMDPSPWLAG